ncbi:MAG TPA: glycosyltransferase family 9 protein [Candidatus Limnocylindrales bacterium]|nr:glycosyltransferase family 9 protein [Candidatus Limnocylindrales bacterium]
MEYARLLATAFASAILNLAGVFRERRTPKLLVVKLDHLGDVVTATPVFRSIREAFPGASIHALAGPWARDVLAGNPFIDRVLTYESRRFRRRGVSRVDRRHPLRVMRDVAAERYTHVIDLRGDSWTILLPFLSGARCRVDRGTVRIASWFHRRRSTNGADGARSPLHEVESNLAIVGPLVGPPGQEPALVEVFVGGKEQAAVASRLRAIGIPDGVSVVTIHPGASWKPRAWRPENFAEVARQLLARFPVRVCFVGSGDDLDIADRIHALLPDARAHFFFDSSLSETVALIERSALFIGNDSGIAHIAAACGTPVIALYGPQDPRRFRPWSGRSVVLHKPVPCFPCKQTVCIRPENPCVNLITVEEVVRSAEAVLA